MEGHTITEVPAYRIERRTWASELGAAGLVVSVAALLVYPMWGDSAGLRLVVEIAYYLALAEIWNLLAGYAGLVSVGQQAYVGFGGYGFFALTLLFGVPPLWALPLAGVLSAAVALPTSFLVFRLRGAYFAIGTWVVAEVFRLLLALATPLGGGTGKSLPVAVVRAVAEPPAMREVILYYHGLALGLGAVALVYALLRSSLGLALTAIRDSEMAAASVGVDAPRAKRVVYLLAAGVTGCIGALAFLEKLRISPDAAFSVGDWTVDVIFIVVIGGIGSIEGPILGTLVFFTLRGFLVDYGAWYLISLGGLAVAVMLFAPRGLWGLLAGRFDLHLFPVQRRVRLVEPSESRKAAS